MQTLANTCFYESDIYESDILDVEKTWKNSNDGNVTFASGVSTHLSVSREVHTRHPTRICGAPHPENSLAHGSSLSARLTEAMGHMVI